MNWRYELEKIRTKITFWLARRIPRRVVYWSMMKAGWEHIEGDEVVPEVPFMTILSRI